MSQVHIILSAEQHSQFEMFLHFAASNQHVGRDQQCLDPVSTNLEHRGANFATHFNRRLVLVGNGSKAYYVITYMPDYAPVSVISLPLHTW